MPSPYLIIFSGAVIALLYGLYATRKLLRAPNGTERMQ